MPTYTLHNFPVDLASHQAQSVQTLQNTGPRIPVEVHLSDALAQYYAQQSMPIPQPQAGWALVDTGASISAVDKQALLTLGIQPITPMQVQTPSGQTTQFAHPVKLSFPGTGLPDWPLQVVLGADLAPQGLLVLIGRDMLQFMTLVYNGTIGVVSISF